MMNGALEMNKWILAALIRLKWRRAANVFNCWICMFARSVNALYLLCVGAECEFACAPLYLEFRVCVCVCICSGVIAVLMRTHLQITSSSSKAQISNFILAARTQCRAIAKQGTYHILHTTQFSAQKVTAHSIQLWIRCMIFAERAKALTGPGNCISLFTHGWK